VMARRVNRSGLFVVSIGCVEVRMSK